MKGTFQVIGLKTRIISPGDSLLSHIEDALKYLDLIFEDNDILVIAESAVATAQGRVISLAEIKPSDKAKELAEKYVIEPSLAEIVLRESDTIIGGIPGFLLSIKSGHLLPNAGIDGSNAPEGMVTLLPEKPDETAHELRKTILSRYGKQVAIIIVDSRTHPMRYGCGGVAIGCSGIPSVIDERGKKDIFGRELKVTRRAVADNIASAAELVMGEADERIPAVIIRDLDIEFGEYEGIELISPDECLFIGSLKKPINQN
ncbi:MAG: coenzyme F420-0:L-glutamate ligase [Methanomicrobiales archaeon]|nr:coenzyme F420-0:L-glutamate ligase [Methanomicrobiales archaeon]